MLEDIMDGFADGNASKADTTPHLAQRMHVLCFVVPCNMASNPQLMEQLRSVKRCADERGKQASPSKYSNDASGCGVERHTAPCGISAMQPMRHHSVLDRLLLISCITFTSFPRNAPKPLLLGTCQIDTSVQTMAILLCYMNPG